MMMARLHTADTSSRMWVEMMMAFSGAKRLISSRTSCFWFGSRPSVGSSSTRAGGSCSSAWAKPTRRLKPLDKVSIGCNRTASNSVSFIAPATRSAASLPR
jgi:hypothetical protein